MPRKINSSRVVAVGYLAQEKSLRLNFQDGFEGTLPLSQLGLGSKIADLQLETVRTRDRGASVQILKKDGGEFDICSDSLRALLDPVYAQQLREELVSSLRRSIEKDPGLLKELARRLQHDKIVD